MRIDNSPQSHRSMAEVKIFIVEDEIFVAKDLESRLRSMGYHVLGIAKSALEAREFLSSHPCDLLIIDINLKGEEDGISLATEVNEHWPMPIIFLTSFADSTTINRAKKTRPAAYMLKPFNDPELGVSIDLAMQNYAGGAHATQPEPPQEPQVEEATYVLNSSLFLRKRDRFERLDFQDVLWAEAQSNYTIIVAEKESFMMAITLQEIEKQLQAPYFIRTHRSYVVNLHKIESIAGNSLYIRDKSIPVSKNNREKVFRHFRKV